MQNEIPKTPNTSPEVNNASREASLLTRLTRGGAEGKQNLDDFVEGLDILPFVRADPAQYFNWPGHPTLVAQLSAGGWQTEALVATRDNMLHFTNPARHFNIHFEVQVLQDQSKMALFLHYETNPYFSQQKLRTRADSASLEQYYDRRNQFIAEFAAQCQVPGFRLAAQVVQIGKAEYEFRGKTAPEVASWLAPIIDEVTCAVNDTLHTLDARQL